MPENHDRRGSGFNDRQYDEIKVVVRAENAALGREERRRHEALLQRLHEGDERMTRIEAAMKVNTDATLEMLAAFDLAKKGLQVFGAIGTAISWVIRKGWPLWGPVAAFIAWYKGAPPPDHH